MLNQCPRVTAAAITSSSICPKCGITKKSGKMSCCGQGGSWFGNCGSASDTNADHTWHEGLQACKGRPHFSQELTKAEEQRNGSPNGDSSVNSKVVVTAVKPHASTSASVPDAPPTSATAHTLANTSTVHITLSMKSKVHTAAVTTVAPTSSSISKAATSIIRTDTPSITSVHILLRYNSCKILMSTKAYAPFTSNGCKQVVDITVYISLMLTVALRIY